jgi:FtsP/CotA-like multicopper oxidase with cupredoxin domain
MSKNILDRKLGRRDFFKIGGGLAVAAVGTRMLKGSGVSLLQPATVVEASSGSQTPHYKGRVTPAERRAAAERAAAARRAAGIKTRTEAVMNPGGMPDFFGTIPNWANSPQAIYGIPTLTITDATGTGADAVAEILGVTGITILTGGAGYTSAPTVTINGGGGSDATGVAVLTGGAVSSVSLTNSGNGYIYPPAVTFGGGGGAGAAATAVIQPLTVTGGPLTGILLLAGGSGYTAPSVAITGGGGTGALCSATVLPISCGITAITLTNPGSGYGALKTNAVGGIYGMRKFVDTLPGLTVAGANERGQYIPVAIPDILTYPTSDYYEISLVEYSEQLHADLPPTRLRGYKQTNTSDPTVSIPSYLGPVIVAHKDRPVRIKFTNNLPPTTAGGNLFIPVDTTAMGAGAGPVGSITVIKVTAGGSGYTSIPAVTFTGGGGGSGAAAEATVKGGAVTSVTVNNVGVGYTAAPTVVFTGGGGLGAAATALIGNGSAYAQNRSALHLHGGNTPWISDGTPHQWTTPATEVTPYPKGVSVRNVPDMPDPGDGSLTFFYTNQQSARLMFYHDHAYGITRLNVYAGVAAGYLLRDPVEAALVSGGTFTKPDGTVVTVPAGGVLPSAEIPLIIQDKTFVDAGMLPFQDPTWNSGTTNPITPNTGDLWFPHVYMPNQNPWDMSGANAVGRWDYGPWFWPPFQGLLYGPVPNPLFGTTPLEGPENPGTPNPSMVPESFMDTPLVNGCAYPKYTVQPQAYRLRILNACNDRFLNLQLYKADPAVVTPDGRTNTEVKMVAASPAGGLPLNWPTDGRDGGVPDPASVGPAWIQIGTEGGFMPAPAVVPIQPVAYNYNRRDIVVLNIATHSLLMGPAERADVVVDFSAFAGQSLILYNDAPAPVPAFDPRIDYYTGDPDQTSMGGAPTTLPGFGPNTRTIMQINVAAATPVPYNPTPLNTFLPAAFAASQPTIIVPQAAYNAAYGASYPTDNYVRIQDNNLRKGPILSVSVTNGGSGYTTAPAVAFAGGGGSGAAATATVAGGKVTAVTLTNQGFGYLTAPTVSFTGGGGTLAAANAVVLKSYLEPKAIQELFTVDYGRMNATLGVEIALTNGIIQTTIPYGYIDPPTEIIKNSNPAALLGSAEDGTQIWKITHNGVDTHAIHVHLFNAQLINRVGWDGAVRPPEPNELGWKETIRMNPLEDAIIALKPVMQTLPFKIGNSYRPMDVTLPIGSTMGFFNVDPAGQPAVVTNQVINFGYEYVWHCHLLGHEENDMMRPIIFALGPEAPSNLVVTGLRLPLRAVLTWTDNATDESGFTVQKATSAAGPWVTIKTLPASPGSGGTVTYTDSAVAINHTYFYRVLSNNVVGDTAVYAPPIVGWPHPTIDSLPSNVVVAGPAAAPSNLVASQPGTRTSDPVLLTWTDNAPNVANPPNFNAEATFTLQRSTTAVGPWSNVSSVIPPAPGTGTTVRFSDRLFGRLTTYYYRVMAVNIFGSSAWSPVSNPITTR